MGTVIMIMVLGYGCYLLCKSAPKMLRFAADNPTMCRGGGMMLKRMFGK